MGYDTVLALRNGAQTYFVFLIVGIFVSLIGSFVVFSIYVSRPEGKSGTYRQFKDGSYIQRFIRFQKLIVADITRWFYILMAMLIAIEGLINFIYYLTLISLDGVFLWVALFHLVVVPLLELLIRLAYEMRMLNVHIANDVSNIRSILTDKFGESSGGLDLGLTPGENIPVYQQQWQYQQQPVPQPQSQPGVWYCPNCKTPNRGTFCKSCGAHRP